jgi:hypothetical protein
MEGTAQVGSCVDFLLRFTAPSLLSLQNSSTQLSSIYAHHHIRSHPQSRGQKASPFLKLVLGPRDHRRSPGHLPALIVVSLLPINPLSESPQPASPLKTVSILSDIFFGHRSSIRDILPPDYGPSLTNDHLSKSSTRLSLPKAIHTLSDISLHHHFYVSNLRPRRHCSSPTDFSQKSRSSHQAFVKTAPHTHFEKAGMDEWAVIVVVGRHFRPRDEILQGLTSLAVILVQLLVLALTLAQIYVGRDHSLREYHACLLCIAHS